MQKNRLKATVAKGLAGIMVFSMLASATVPAADSQAAAKPKLNAKTVSVTVKKTKKITVKGSKIKSTTWSVVNKKIASLSKKKKTSVTVKGVKKGNTKVKAKVKIGKKTYNLTCTVKVSAQKSTPVPTKTPTKTPTKSPTPTKAPEKESISLDQTKLDVMYNSVRFLTATVTPANATVTWTTSNKDVATVDNGKVKAVGNGTAVITATAGKVSATCNVSVTKYDIGTNVINANFDDGVIAPWSPRATDTIPTAVIDDTQGVNGTKCLKITDRKSIAQGALLELTDFVEPSATYEFKAMVRVADNATDNTAIILSTQTKAVETGMEAYENKRCVTTKKSNWGCAATYIEKDPRQWNEVTFQVTTPDDIAHFGLYFETGNDGSCDLLVDSTSLTLIDRNAPDYNLPSLYETFKNLFPDMGVAVGYNQLMGENATDFVLSQYNSITMGNEMKPNAIFPNSTSSSSFLTIDEAKALGYYIPEAYVTNVENKKTNAAYVKEYSVPKLRFDVTDDLLKRAHEKGLKMRMHTLLWHQQTPAYFFKKEYKAGEAAENCSVAAMDTRIEFFVKTVMKHILDSPYSDVVYSVDVVNEYFHSHNSDTPARNPEGLTFYERIYNTNETGEKMITNPSYVKLAFKAAYDILVEKGRTDISLIYNDFNTYGEDTADRIVTMYNWLNTKDSVNTDGAKICDGVGEQAHLNVTNAYHSVANLTAALNKYAAAGMEILITEWDAGADPSVTAQQQADYFGATMKAFVDVKKAGGNLSGITVWGLYDATSWRASSSPLPFKGIYNPKPAFYSMLDQAK